VSPEAAAVSPEAAAVSPEAAAVSGDDVVTWSLQMLAADRLRPSAEPADPPLLMTAERPAPELARFFYTLVGARWSWTDRLAWPDERWVAWVERPEHHLVTGWHDGAPAGYYELEQQPDGVVEIAYFGLAPAAIGRGWGGWLLSRAAERAWQLPGTRRIWVHTCSLDHPHALANYQARGFVRFRETRSSRAGQG
jgi:GNAT superfamily N-acetyltransferase